MGCTSRLRRGWGFRVSKRRLGFFSFYAGALDRGFLGFALGTTRLFAPVVGNFLRSSDFSERTNITGSLYLVFLRGESLKILKAVFFRQPQFECDSQANDVIGFQPELCIS